MSCPVGTRYDRVFHITSLRDEGIVCGSRFLPISCPSRDNNHLTWYQPSAKICVICGQTKIRVSSVSIRGRNQSRHKVTRLTSHNRFVTITALIWHSLTRRALIFWKKRSFQYRIVEKLSTVDHAEDMNLSQVASPAIKNAETENADFAYRSVVQFRDDGTRLRKRFQALRRTDNQRGNPFRLILRIKSDIIRDSLHLFDGFRRPKQCYSSHLASLSSASFWGIASPRAIWASDSSTTCRR